MNTPLKVEFKIGAIEFKAEGDPTDVEKQRESFVNTLLPLAVDAMIRTHSSIVENQQYIEANDARFFTNTTEISEETKAVPSISMSNIDNIDFSRESLNTYINKFGNITDQEFVVLATYFAESKNGKIVSITSETVKQYYEEARRTKYSNPSQLLTELVKRDFSKMMKMRKRKYPNHMF